MPEITIKRNKDFMITFRALKVYINDKFIDYIEPNEHSKKFEVNTDEAKVRVKVDWCSSNTYHCKLGRNKTEIINVSSQIHNGLFILIFSSFIAGSIFKLLNLIDPYTYLALFLPLTIIVGWQTFGRNNYLRLSGHQEMITTAA